MTAIGEGIIRAGDREIPVYFNNRALASAEQAMDKSIIAVANGFADGQTGIGDLAHLLRAGMDAARREQRLGGRAPTMVEAYDVLDRAGFAEVAQVVMTAVAAVLGYSSGDDEEDAGDPN